ncbi:hypothetical protein HMPREF0290_0774 [Corynebacterium efficiens YS-314]|uniref:Uncharacterized protein n=1 Tax=Corynebacterium efficiens (strain DSM 44549 / YS-314 / AJ 12310 / JCM 11189 / NBRC 100395) TaxID=196164 RepID=Q8FPT7_COREF|nr:hypothetical protein HMPREF0290_0774 [Corynebacterium efficiens YS-314]BAC18211.1 hypothetical protein [Corynebacterium efficiens YS-314]
MPLSAWALPTVDLTLESNSTEKFNPDISKEPAADQRKWIPRVSERALWNQWKPIQ